MDSEEEQLEELKRWWKEHGRTVVAGVVLGLGSVVGWTSWRAHQDAQAEQISLRYEKLLNTAAIPNRRGTVEQADAIIAEHPDSAYAALAALVGAHAAYNGKDMTTAQRLLEWAASHGDSFEVSDVARVRLARVLSEQGQHDAALAALDRITHPEFSAVRSETRGDVLAAKPDAAGARAAYESALADGSLPEIARERIRRKLDALPSSG